MEIGERINKLRTEKGMTLEELGNKVGVAKSTVRKWEKGMIQNMRRDKVVSLAKALDCSIEYLLGYNIQPNNILTDNENEYSTNPLTNNFSDSYENVEVVAIAKAISEHKELFLLFEAAIDASPEDLQTIITMLLALKRKDNNE